MKSCVVILVSLGVMYPVTGISQRFRFYSVGTTYAVNQVSTEKTHNDSLCTGLAFGVCGNLNYASTTIPMVCFGFHNKVVFKKSHFGMYGGIEYRSDLQKNTLLHDEGYEEYNRWYGFYPTNTYTTVFSNRIFMNVGGNYWVKRFAFWTGLSCQVFEQDIVTKYFSDRESWRGKNNANWFDGIFLHTGASYAINQKFSVYTDARTLLKKVYGSRWYYLSLGIQANLLERRHLVQALKARRKK